LIKDIHAKTHCCIILSVYAAEEPIFHQQDHSKPIILRWMVAKSTENAETLFWFGKRAAVIAKECLINFSK
jgi:hypothetical protein